MRVAAVDIGTNSVLLLISELRNGALVPVVERATITRLGEGVDRTREFAPAARQRTLECLRHYAEELERQKPDELAVVGTSAFRDARGGPELAAEVGRVLGAEPEVVSGRREAELAFRGALSGLAVVGPILVVDVGGGSTEIVTGSRASESSSSSIAAAESLDVGSVRLFERHVTSDPPSRLELERVRGDVREALGRASKPGAETTLVGVAGTVTTLAAIIHDVEPYDSTRIHGRRVTLGELRELVLRLSSLSLEERKSLRGLDARRADVIVTGGLIVECVLDWAEAEELVVSDRGVRWGLVEELARRAGAT